MPPPADHHRHPDEQGLLCRERFTHQKVAVAGGVSANSGLRSAFEAYGKRYGWKIHIPKFAFTTDNAAMVAITGYYKYVRGEFCGPEVSPYARVSI